MRLRISSDNAVPNGGDTHVILEHGGVSIDITDATRAVSLSMASDQMTVASLEIMCKDGLDVEVDDAVLEFEVAEPDEETRKATLKRIDISKLKKDRGQA